jgi:hypothetical protein
MRNFRVLVFPCGSEIGLEIYHSLCYSPHIELIGASSVDDHGKFVFSNYIGDIPSVDEPNFMESFSDVVKLHKIDAIYPTMDKIIWKLKSFEKELGCLVISSPARTTKVCLSKNLTYLRLHNLIKTPITYRDLMTIKNFPVFIKPDIGYGSRGIFRADDSEDIKYFFSKQSKSDYVISEYLTGDEYTVDCFTDRHRKLRFCGPRLRQRVSNGISVNTIQVTQNLADFLDIAEIVNNELEMKGAWFFQVKRDKNGSLTLLEIAARLGGSSSLHRGRGVNFALLSLYDSFDMDVEIMENSYDIELDRALNRKYKISLKYSTVYVDFDDCLIINNIINVQLVSFLYGCFNLGKRIILLTKHEKEIFSSLNQYRLNALFDEVIQISKTKSKSDYITSLDSIFIDDSFQERRKVKEERNIPVFSPDMIEVINPFQL